MSVSTSLEKQVEQGLQKLGISVASEKLITYLDLLDKWNHTYNLTAVRDINEMVSRHILDSLAILPYLHPHRVLDVGTGAGLPGIPLAIAKPELHFVLLDSNGKKIRFLQEAKRLLLLNNVEVIQSRVETYHPNLGFDTVVSRAFSEVQQMIKWTNHLIKPDGVWLAMKGQIPTDELIKVNYSYDINTYSVPGTLGERCCVIVKNE